MEPMELSLDDIIKAKKPAFPKRVNAAPGFKPKANFAPAAWKPQIADARSKIIQKNRAKIRDVRDLISAKKKPVDARYVITKNMKERLGKMGAAAHGPPRHRKPMPDLYPGYEIDDRDLVDLWAQTIPMKYSPTKMRAPRQYPDHDLAVHGEPLRRRRSYVDYDAIEDTQPLTRHATPSFDSLFQDYMSAKQAPLPAAPRYKAPVEEDVFDLYDAPARDRRPMPPSPSNLRRFTPAEESQLSYEMRSRLEGHASAPKSMGIFANPTKPLSGGSSSSTKGYRVMVTNLHSSVTVWDIQELFADIGGLLSAEIVKPGVAEVIYKTVKDAEDAVEVYHNRQLDGQPMKCHLITAPPTAMHTSNSGYSRKPPLELDIDVLHSALFTSKRH